MSVLKETLLFAKSSGGGKEYKVVLTAEPGGTYAVNAYYGPAGNLRQNAAQGSGLSIAEAEALYLKAIKKKANGSGSSVYTIIMQSAVDGINPDSSLVGASTKVIREALSPYEAQLLTSIDTEADLKHHLRTGQFIAQVKADGDRVMCQVKNGKAFFFNRKGQARIGAHQNIESAVLALETDCFIDGEVVGDTYYVFDFLSHCNQDLRRMTYESRFRLLKKLVCMAAPFVVPVKTVFHEEGFDAQWALFEEIKDSNEEGVVLHKASCPHTPGKSDSHLKFKLKERSTCIVGSINQKRSVALRLIGNDGVLVDVGNVSIPPNYEIPAVGDLVEIEYLYKFMEGSFFQPVYMGKRLDVSYEECTLAQVLRYKNQPAMAA